MNDEDYLKRIEKGMQEDKKYVLELVGESPILCHHDNVKQIHKCIVSKLEQVVEQVGKFQLDLVLLLPDNNEGVPNRGLFFPEICEAWIKFCDWHHAAERKISHEEYFSTRQYARKILAWQLQESLKILVNSWSHPVIHLSSPCSGKEDETADYREISVFLII